MLTKVKPNLALTAADVMSRAVITLPLRMPLREAARLLWRAGTSGAPVIDDVGRCVGMLTAVDFLRWSEDGVAGATHGPVGSCSFQRSGRLSDGEEVVICTLAAGSCPLQATRPGTGGRNTTACLHPTGVLSDWQQVPEAGPGGSVQGHMTSDVVTAPAHLPLAELARVMIDARVHRVPVVDDRGRPVGIATSTAVLAALAREWLSSARPEA